MSEVRVRFPPSPTGYLHIGSARTAIYNWLYARKHGGKLVLRIEDTDAERSTRESIEGIISGLEWLGIDWDEGPYFQTEHREEHLTAAERLIAGGHAYRCFCQKEDLERKRELAERAKTTYRYDRTCRGLSRQAIAEKQASGIPSVVRFAVPERPGSVGFRDLVYGPIERPYSEIEDFVIVRSDGSPLYLLSNVVDDIRDRITHVIRGQDGLANTPRQILLYEALGAPLPVFAHMSFTLDPKKAKISKRSHGDVVTVQFYREKGFLSWALINFLVLLGWSPGDDREIFSRQELIEAFSLEGLTKANAVFNYNKNDEKFFTDPKALNINAHYVRNLPVEELAPLVERELVAAGLWDERYGGERRDWFLGTVDLIRSRYHTLKDFSDAGRAYFADTFSVDPKPVVKNISKHEKMGEWLQELGARFEALEVFDLEETERVTRELADELGVKPGILINATRTVCTGQAAGAGLFEILVAIGRARVVYRLKNMEKVLGQQ